MEVRKLSLALEEGFLHDRVRISAGGRELASFDDLSTRVQIGLAQSLDLELPEGEHALVVELPDKGLKTEIPIGDADTYVGISVADDGEIVRSRIGEAPMGYA